MTKLTSPLLKFVHKEKINIKNNQLSSSFPKLCLTLIDFNDFSTNGNNEYLAVSQLWIQG